MASRKPPRLTRNQHGVYTLRIVLPQHFRNAQGNRRERRISLGTRDAQQARMLAMQINLLIERWRTLSMSDHRHYLSPWTLTAGSMKIEVNGQDDLTHFTSFLNEHPEIKAKIIAAIAAGASEREAAQALKRMMGGADPAASANLAALHPAQAGLSAHPTSPLSPVSMEDAIAAFVGTRKVLDNNRRTTSEEKRRTLEMLLDYLAIGGQERGKILVHQLTRPTLLSFVTHYANRPGKGSRRKGAADKPGDALKGRTVLKAIGHLRDFCDYAVANNMLPANPIDDSFDKATGGIRKKAAAEKSEDQSDPFSDEQLGQIFKPDTYLRLCSAADEFWSPLIGLYTGMRLGEIVTRHIDDFEVDADSGLTVIKVGIRSDDLVKNQHSKRRVPVPQTLIDLGLLDYIDHIRGLGAKRLFPHRVMNATRANDPSKHESRAFGEYLDHHGIVSPKLVFHSLRHTALTWMHLAPEPVPLKDAELIAGHESQETYQRIEHAQAAQRRGRERVQPSIYIHADTARQGVPMMARLKGHLDRTLTFDLDLEGLRIAADIVRGYMRLAEKRPLGAKRNATATDEPNFKSGWHTNAKRVADEALADFSIALAESRAASRNSQASIHRD